MPAKNITAWAKMKGKSKAEIEKYWARAKERTMDQYGMREPTKSTKKKQKEKFYKIVMAIFKKMIGIKESQEEKSLLLRESSRHEFQIISNLKD